jgi:hypothetical protein
MTTEEPARPWLWPPSDWLRAWASWFPPAPHSLNQPILPGWTVAPVLNVNSGNSSAPQTEAEIVQRHSYGRQLGRISDAVEALIELSGAAEDKRLTEFITMKREIDAMKLDASAARIVQLAKDLAALKEARPDDYRRLREPLRRMFEDG